MDGKVHSSEALRFSLAITTPSVIQRHEIVGPADRGEKPKESEAECGLNVALNKRSCCDLEDLLLSETTATSLNVHCEADKDGTGREGN